MGLIYYEGVTVNIEQINSVIEEYILSKSPRGWADLGSILSGVKSLPSLRWANSLDVKNAVERILTKTYGPKDQAKGKTPKVSSFFSCRTI